MSSVESKSTSIKDILWLLAAQTLLCFAVFVHFDDYVHQIIDYDYAEFLNSVFGDFIHELGLLFQPIFAQWTRIVEVIKRNYIIVSVTVIIVQGFNFFLIFKWYRNKKQSGTIIRSTKDFSFKNDDITDKEKGKAL